MKRIITAFVVALLFAPTSLAQTDSGKRRVFVLHSGMHLILAPDDKNLAAKTLKELLHKRGIPERDLVALDCPYPTASWTDVVPRAGLLMYLESADPASRSSQEGYVRLHKALQAQGVTSKDQLVWIGHSAGGQMGMAMANLGHNLAKYPDLARKAIPYRFEMVVTLGSGIGANPVPASVQLRHYYSAADVMIFMLSKQGTLLGDSLGLNVRFAPCHDLKENARVRVFQDVEHPSWCHVPQVLDCLLREFEPSICPAWRQTQAEVGCGLGLAQLFARALESQWRISLEER